MATASRSTIRELGEGFPRNVALMTLEEFEQHPCRAIIRAGATDFGTLIYTIGNTEDGERGHRGVAVIVPVEEYRRLTLKPEPA